MFYTPIQLSERQAKTPEGFLICYGCAIARTGFQLYNEMEVNCPPGDDGMIKVYRDEAEVFSPETLLSGEGKDIVIEHPDGDVLPGNWRELSHGHMQNIRRGSGVEDHLLLADLVFKSPESIAMIERNPRTQLSCGYDARYKIHGPGHAEQTEIRINHCACVKAARCGPTCATRDAARTLDLWSKTDPEKAGTLPSVCCQSASQHCSCKAQRTGDTMAKSWRDKIRDAFATKDVQTFDAACNEAEERMASTASPAATNTRDDHHFHFHIGGHGPETTKPAGDLPETGETKVTNAADDAAKVGGETKATFGGHAFFSDAETNTLFHKHMDDMGNQIMGMHGEMAGMKKTVDTIHEMLKAKDDAGSLAHAPGEEPAHEQHAKEIEGELKEEAPPGTGDINKHKDSAFMGDSFKKTCQDAEILVPGIGLPTFDSAAKPEDGYKVICGVRRKALIAFGATVAGEKALTEVTQVRDFAGCSCKDITGAFRAAVAMQRTKNSDLGVRGFKDGEVQKVTGTNSMVSAPFTLAEWQAAIDKHNAAEDARAAE